jgi:beta-glucosidase
MIITLFAPLNKEINHSYIIVLTLNNNFSVMMKHYFFQSSTLLLLSWLLTGQPVAAKGIYHKGWIDFNKNGRMDVFEDPSAPTESRIKDLLSQMTVEEKTCQMATLYGSGRVLKDAAPTPDWKNQIWKDGIANIDEQANGVGSFGSQLSFPYAKSVENRQTIQRWFVEQTRLGIPVDFTNEGIRGLNHDRATMFPAQCAQGASWDKNLITAIANAEAEEAVALGYTNIYSPILDLAQDPRWGRVVESYGEDPYLVSELGKRMIMGLQSHGLVSTPKHFAVYSVPVGGRDGGTRTDPHVAPREMRTLYMEPFRKAFMEAGALGVMSSYNDYNGEPITGSPYFLTQLLRREYGFRGYVVSDSEAVEMLFNKHHVAKDDVEGAAKAVNAGLNVRTNFTMPEKFIMPLRKAISEGLVSMQTIDSRVADVLRIKFYLGLFDNPYKGDKKQVETIVHSADHQQLALRAAQEAIVLLKNDNHILPLSKDTKRIAVIGPNADEREKLVSRYGPANAPIKTVLQGIREELPGADIKYAKGCEIIDKYFPESELYNVPLDSTESQMIAQAVETARQSDVAILVLGGNEMTVREEYSRTSLNLCGRQEQLLEAVAATGKPVVLVLVDGRAESINWAQRYIHGIVHAWFPGECTGTAVANVLFGDYNPGGKLAVTFPKSVGQIPLAFPMKPGSDSDGHVRVAHALYPFGYGLSYTTFKYSDLHIQQPVIGKQDSLVVTCTITNTGDRDGDEVAQLYLHDDVSSVIRYVKELKGFERIHLKAGESRQVQFVLKPHDLGLWTNASGEERFEVEPGTFSLMIGSSSDHILLKGSFEVK